MPPLRYVILHHTGIAEPHYDLMFETRVDSLLATWRLPVWPPAESTIATRLSDHRRAYLEYEGPVSNNRGEVRRIESGTIQITLETPESWVLNLGGRKLRLRPAGENWVAEIC